MRDQDRIVSDAELLEQRVLSRAFALAQVQDCFPEKVCLCLYVNVCCRDIYYLIYLDLSAFPCKLFAVFLECQGVD